MIRILVALSLSGFSSLSIAVAMEARGLSCEHITDPMGIETSAPRFSWKLDSTKNGQAQTAWQILVSGSPELLAADKGDVWDSGWQEGGASRLIPYAGEPLASLQSYWWKVRVKDRSGEVSQWSPPARFATGLLDGKVPAGEWIFDSGADPKTGVSWFRKSFRLESVPKQALVLLASRGYHEFFVNGKKVGDRALAPNASITGPGAMAKRTLYVVYDIAPFLQAGENTLAVWLSPGRVGANPKVAPAFLIYANFGGQIVVSDTSWKTKVSTLSRYFPDVPKPFFGGERWDDGASVPAWNKKEYSDSDWPAATSRSETSVLSSDITPPTRRVETIEAKKVERRPDGSVLVDFGGYFTGQLEARVQGEPGQPVRFRTLGDLAKPVDYGQISEVVPGPTGKAVFQHHFNWICGRWIEVTGLTGNPCPPVSKCIASAPISIASENLIPQTTCLTGCTRPTSIRIGI